MIISLFQSNIIWENKKANLIKLESACIESVAKGAELILLPEMSFTGFSMNTSQTVEIGTETAEKVQELCVKFGLHIGYGWVSRSVDNEKLCYNHYSIMAPSGMLYDYVKIHPFSFSGENQYFMGGNSFGVFHINNISCSVFICYDLRFPEIFQKVSDKAHIIIIPANWPAKRSAHWDVLLRARAIENQCYIIGINCIGNIGGLDYVGGCQVIDPNGEVVAKNTTTEEEIIIYDLTDNVDEMRSVFPTKKDRRPIIYGYTSINKQENML